MTSDPLLRPSKAFRRHVLRTARRLRRDRSGLALTEFAMSLPILLLLATAGLELTNYVITVKRISEIAMQVADNASRMGAQNAVNNKPVSEAEINDVLIGSTLQGKGLNIEQHGRVILSSLQRNKDNGQTIAWQRCLGAFSAESSYGEEGDGATGTSLTGMGPSGNEVTASPGNAVMVVEIFYDYQHIMPVMQFPLRTIRDVSAFNVRDTRDLTTIYNIEGVTPSSCD